MRFIPDVQEMGRKADMGGGGVSYWAETFEQDNRIFCFSLSSLFSSSLPLFAVEQLESFQKTLGCTWGV